MHASTRADALHIGQSGRVADMVVVTELESRRRARTAEIAALIRRAVRESRQLTDDERAQFEGLQDEISGIERDLEAAFYGDAGESGDHAPVHPQSPSGAPGRALEPPSG